MLDAIASRARQLVSINLLDKLRSNNEIYASDAVVLTT